MSASPQIASLLGRRGRLELDEILAALVVDGYVLADDAKQVRMGARAGRATVELHPLVVIANAGHQWPGSIRHLRVDDWFGTAEPSPLLDATARLWQFFAAHPLQ